MTMRMGFTQAGVLAVLALSLMARSSGAPAQPAPSGPPNALQGFSQNRDQPVKIEAATLEVRDKNKVATFSGNVHLVQGDTVLRCKVLVVFYDEPDGAAPAGGAPAVKSAAPGPTGSSQIRRMEAKGAVVVTQKDQTATGDSAIYDIKDNTVTLIAPAGGMVTVTQGQNVMSGPKLVVNLTTNVSHFEGGVSGLIMPNSAKKTDAKTDAKSTPDAKGAAREGPREAPREAPKPQSTSNTRGLY
jgi:lipopolysaccharide export system protein LptA